MNKSFTLIEVLVVIVIIGILSSFLIISISNVITLADDAKLKNDINSLQKVIFASRGTGVFPIEESVCNIGENCTELESVLIPKYYPSQSSIPKNSNNTYYTYQSDLDGNDFIIKGLLSNGNIYQYKYSEGFSESVPPSGPEERVTNGGFEDGLNGWTYSGSPAWTTTTIYKHGGTSSAYNNYFYGQNLSQSIDLTDVNNLSLWFKTENGLSVKVKLNGVEVYQSLYDTWPWTNINIDVSLYSGSHTLSFDVGNGDSNLYIDDVSALTVVP